MIFRLGKFIFIRSACLAEDLPAIWLEWLGSLRTASPTPVCYVSFGKIFLRGGAGGGAEFVEGTFPDLSNELGDFFHVSRFATLAR